MPGVMYQVSKLLSLFSLPLIYTDSSAHTVNTMKLTFTQSLHLDFRTRKNLLRLRVNNLVEPDIFESFGNIYLKMFL